jgi:hypothetical protein
MYYEYKKVPSMKTLWMWLLNWNFGINIANYTFTYLHAWFPPLFKSDDEWGTFL